MFTRSSLLLLVLLGAACSGEPAPAADLAAAPRADRTPAAREAGIQLPDAAVYDRARDAGFVCSPPAKPGELYALEAKTPFATTSLCQYRGRVLLIVNIAAKCGYTPQLGTLAKVQSSYGDAGLTILGFYSNQFLQAGSQQEQDACEASYGVNFKTFPDVNVNPPGEDPIFSWLKAQPGGAGPVLWNFEKFLVSRDGRLLERYATAVAPDAPELSAAIEAALKP